MAADTPNPEPKTAGRPFDEDRDGAARAYAEALVNAASRDSGGDAHVDAVLAELAEFRDDVWNAHPAFADLLQSRTRSSAEKDALLVRILDGRALPIVANFLRVLNRNDRLGLLDPAIDQAFAIWDDRRARRKVLVRSAVPLDDDQRRAVLDRTRTLLNGGTPILQETVDSSLIGGLVLQIGDDLYDLSVRRRLQLLRQRLVESKLTEIRSRGGRFLA